MFIPAFLILANTLHHNGGNLSSQIRTWSLNEQSGNSLCDIHCLHCNEIRCFSPKWWIPLIYRKFLSFDFYNICNLTHCLTSISLCKLWGLSIAINNYLELNTIPQRTNLTPKWAFEYYKHENFPEYDCRGKHLKPKADEDRDADLPHPTERTPGMEQDADTRRATKSTWIIT